MRNSLVLFLLILIGAALAQLVLPWWSAAVVAGLLGLWWGRHAGRTFLAGFNGVGMGWMALATWHHLHSGGELSQRVAQLLPLSGNAWALVVVTAVLGGLVGGLAALAGVWIRQAVAPVKYNNASDVAETTVSRKTVA
ncbi:hypothetical protein F0P96_14260 [Hymenobacter busanensis]|uniref:Uncharacterized protein n=1 Tax=Hymenobacter busanensis TaxID=2607656 RepID=A0A7L4ZZ88_9BACT|nr:hypothetical protein [Hymenobacter busanensis]KAA9331404.1 hypothetical protein F0P96_14260 [Hymenobacter busanensis]QHJ08558.1 hypothetical protein GUY19_15190 [Hymenobacter busanensis]